MIHASLLFEYIIDVLVTPTSRCFSERFKNCGCIPCQETAIAEFRTLAGWRLYVTNAPEQWLSLSESKLRLNKPISN